MFAEENPRSATLGTMAAKRSVPAPRIGSRGSRPKRNQRVRLDLTLTGAERRQLKAAAEREIRSIGNFIGWIVVRHLRSHKKSLKLKAISGPRSKFDLAVSFTPEELAKLEARAEEQRRSLSSYVTLLVVEALGRK